ncbi:adenosine deaminase [Curvivirga aplysinae]|uniref:adenosine deaminase n=1 Tax=Curvivirga aplysinae TaxID=2529852 RepID=UPI0012BC6D10|nr:adenosine deaminase [Curvivirga aplysinae]MTI09917.1 adenosine deaminase [Curvivirga aplysinae]
MQHSKASELFAKLPKAELHLHIEGSFEPKLMFEIAQRNQIELPYKSVEEIRAAYEFNSLQDFLDIYYAGMSVLQHTQDYYDLTMAYLKKSHADNVKHVEIFFDPQGHTERGVPFETVITGIHSALEDGQAKFGISFKLIMSYLRHLSEEDAFKTWEEAQHHLSIIDGIGLDSSEVGHPPSKFKNVFAEAKAKGLKLVAHAGEEGPPEYVYEALDILEIDRVDHGNRSLEDTDLVQRLVHEQKTLTVCPLSNLKLCVVSDMKDHPLRKMLEMGLAATINSDDPSYFGGYMNANFNAVDKALDLTLEETVLLARNSVTGSFAELDRQKELLQEIEAISAPYLHNV